MKMNKRGKVILIISLIAILSVPAMFAASYDNTKVAGTQTVMSDDTANQDFPMHRGRPAGGPENHGTRAHRGRGGSGECDRGPQHRVRPNDGGSGPQHRIQPNDGERGQFRQSSVDETSAATRGSR